MSSTSKSSTLSPTPSSPASVGLPSENLPESPNFREQISDALDTAPEHTFATGSAITPSPPPPCLTIDNTPVTLPLSPSAVSQLTSASAPAPFGRGEHTLVDPSVRHCRQVDAARITLSEDWDDFVNELAFDLSEESLGVYDYKCASLYKLVLYQDGGFFLPHRDTEKEDGMFATLIIQLPCKHDGGGLLVRHRGQEKKFVFADSSADGFFYAAFFADCEHQVLPVRGNRLVLVYNLIRKGRRDRVCLSDAVGTLKEAADEWEKVKGEPNKLVVMLHHNYTDANLSFRLLKGRDAAVVDALQRSDMYDLYLALVQKRKHGSADEHWDDGDPYAEPDGEEEEEEEEEEEDGSDGSQSVVLTDPNDGYEDTSGSHKMIECIEESFKTLEWIDEDDDPAHLGSLGIDVDTEMVDCEDPFTGTPDDEEYEVTGNEGATVDYFYHRAVLVLWPKTRRYANLCASDYDACVKEAIDSVGKKTIDAKRFGTVIQYAADHLEEARKHLVDLLLAACKLRDVEEVQQMMSLFGKPHGIMRHPYFFSCVSGEEKCDGKGAGLCSIPYANAFLQAMKICGFDAVKEKIEAAVSVTNTASLYRCAEFAMRLSKMTGFADAGAFVGNATANQAMSRAFDRNSKVEPIAKMMFTLPTLACLRDIYITKAKSLHPNVQFQIIVALHKHCSTPNRFPNLFEQLVKEYIRRALQTKKDTCRYGDKPEDFAVPVGDIVSILLGPTPRNEGMLETLVAEILACGSEGVLKTVLGKPKVADAVGDAHISRLADVRVAQLLLEKPTFSYRQPGANVEGHPRVEEFLRGEERVMVYQNFSGIKEARNFASYQFKGRARYWGPCEYSATAVAEGRGTEARVVITKTDAMYKRLLQKYREDCREYGRIQRLVSEPVANIRRESKRRKLTSDAGAKRVAEVIDLTDD